MIFSVAAEAARPIWDRPSRCAEFFNAFNRPQLDNPNGQITNFDPAHPGGFGQINNTVADNRDIQFGLKLVF